MRGRRWGELLLRLFWPGLGGATALPMFEDGPLPPLPSQGPWRAVMLFPAGAGLLAVALLSTGCATPTPPPGREMDPGFTSRAVAETGLLERPSDERPRARVFPPPTTPQRRGLERPLRRQGSREVAVEANPGGVVGPIGATRQSAALTRQALLGAIGEVKSSTGSIASALPRLAVRKAGIGGANGAFIRYVTEGVNQLHAIDGALDGALALTDAAAEVPDADMALAILRMAGSRLQGAMFGSLLLATWLDFLNLADVVLQRCPAYGAERLFMDLSRVRRLMAPAMVAFASREPAQVEAAARVMPELMGQLTHEFHSIREGARVATERGGQLIAAAQLAEMLTLTSTLKLSLPRLPPAAPAMLGVGLVMSPSGVMMGSRVVVSAEWVERMRRLVRAGVISVPVASAAVRIHGGQVLMAQAHQDLPRGVRDALGDGPEVRAMHETGRAGAGMSEAPRHHVLPNEHRAWFEQRGFTGEMSIDRFCVELEAANHQAIHGGGNWRLGRTWPGEWNRMIMDVLLKAEKGAGRTLTRDKILNIVAKYMKDYGIPMNFAPGRGR